MSNHDVSINHMIDDEDDERIGLSGRDAEQQFVRLAGAYNEIKAHRDRLREVVNNLLREAVILSDDYLSAFKNEPMDHVIQGWDKARWIRASQAAKQARKALQEAEG